MSTHVIGPSLHHIDVVFSPKGEGLEVLAPCKEQRLDGVARGDSVEWHFHNLGHAITTAEIGAIRLSPRFHNPPGTPATPFLPNCVLQAKVPIGGFETIRCQIDPNLPTPLTYEYHILADGNTLLDPEIEIERP